MKHTCRTWVVVSVLLVVSFDLAAQQPDTGTTSLGFRDWWQARQARPAYVGQEGLTIRTGFGSGQQGISFAIDELGLSHGTIDASPNSPLHWIIGADWDRVGLTFRLTMPNTIDKSGERGTSEYRNFLFQFFGDRYEIDLLYQLHEGMYITNANAFTEEITTIKLPDMTLRTTGFSVFLATDEDFSLAAAYKLNARQQRSEVSWVLMATGSQIVLNGPGGPAQAIPSAAGSIWQEDVSVKAHTGIVGGGVGGTIRVGSFFVSPLLTVGFGGQHLAFAVGGRDGDEWRVAPHVSGRASIGYNGPEFFAAFVGSLDLRNVETSVMNLTQTTGLFEFVIGRRFGFERWREIGQIDPW